MIYIRTVFLLSQGLCHIKICIFVSYFRHSFTKETRWRAAPVRFAPNPADVGRCVRRKKLPDRRWIAWAWPWRYGSSSHSLRNLHASWEAFSLIYSALTFAYRLCHDDCREGLSFAGPVAGYRFLSVCQGGRSWFRDASPTCIGIKKQSLLLYWYLSSLMKEWM